MLIKVEPAGFFMYTVQMCFDVLRPDSEDQDVQDYLIEHDLEPRYQWDNELDGRQCHWMQFGGCYLGSHLQQVGLIQRRAVEAELLTEEINNCLDGLSAVSSMLSDECRSSVVCSLVDEFQRESSYQVNDNGELTVVLDQSDVLEALGRLLDS